MRLESRGGRGDQSQTTEAGKIAVVVVSFNTRELTLECLGSVVDHSENLVARVVVVDNASVDGTPAAIRTRYPEVLLLANDGNRGFGAACNQAVAATHEPFFLLLNSDARLSSGTLATLLRCLSAEHGAAIVGCSLLSDDGEPQQVAWNFLHPLNQSSELLGIGRAVRMRWLRRSHTLETDGCGRDRSIDWLQAACVLVRRSAFEQVGGFDEAYFMYGEDEDLAWRLHRAGYRVVLTTETYAYHQGGASSAPIAPAMSLEHLRSQVKFLHRNRGWWAAQVFLWILGPVLLVKSLAHATRVGAKPPWTLGTWFQVWRESRSMGSGPKLGIQTE